MEVDGEKIVDYQEDADLIRLNENSKDEKLDFLNLDTILEFIQKVEIKILNIIIESITINKNICLEGLYKPYGLKVGMSINPKWKRVLLLRTKQTMQQH